MFCYNCGVEIKQDHKFCFSCGIKLDYQPHPQKEIKVNTSKKVKGSEYGLIVSDKLKIFNLEDIFRKMEAAIRKECFLSDQEFEKNWGSFKKYHYKNYSDNDVYWLLVQVTFYSGMNAATVTKKLPAINKYFNDYKRVKEYSEADINKVLNDPDTIHHKQKIIACINNAKIFNNIIREHGSFSAYLETFGDLREDRTLEILKSDLMKFNYIGRITAYHVMLDLGFNVWKPDRVIRRILHRLDLIDDRENVDQSIVVGKEFSRQIKEPIRYIDIVMVKYGQVGNEIRFGLPNGGICLENNPRCYACGVREYCVRR